MVDKVSFNGVTKTITVLPAFTNISVKDDIYSAWKEWSVLGANIGFLPAMRAIGGDPIGAGRFAGDIYFLRNGWQIVIDHEVIVTGVIYHDDGINVFDVQPSGSVQNIVSSIVQTVTTGGSSSTLTAEEVRIEMDTNSAKLIEAANKLIEIAKKIDDTQAFVLSN